MSPAPIAPALLPSSALATAPMAALPGSEPPVPLAPPALAMSDPTTPSLPPEAMTIPPLSAEPLPSNAPLLASLLLIKPIEVQLAYGKLTLPPGTAVKLVSRDGALLKVSYQNSIMTVPASSTDAE